MTEHIPRPNLLYPDPQKRSDLISWGAANRLLAQEQHRGGADFVGTFQANAREHQALLIRAQIGEMVRPSADIERAIALLGAASAGHIVVYARRIDDQVAYETTPALWLATSPWIANPVTIALSGRLSLVTDLLEHDSLEARLAGSPILVGKGTLTTLLTKRAGNPEMRLQAGRELVKKWSDTHEGRPMPKAEFYRSLAQQFPGVSGRELERIRVIVFPPEWREPGRRRG